MSEPVRFTDEAFRPADQPKPEPLTAEDEEGKPAMVSAPTVTWGLDDWSYCEPLDVLGGRWAWFCRGDTDVPYCIHGCGKPAVWMHQMSDNVTELVCGDHARVGDQLIEELYDRATPAMPSLAAPSPATPRRDQPTDAHLSGKHDQRRHGRKGEGLGRPGMGDIPVDAHWVAGFQGGSAAPFLMRNADGSAQFTPERQAVHDAIVEDALAGKAPPEGQPVMHVLGGGPASGKSSLYKEPEGASMRQPEVVHVAFDDLRAQLPGYQEALAANPGGASGYHMESAYLTARVTSAAAERGLSMTLDTTGNSSADIMRGRIDAARAAGYRIEGHYTTIPIATAIERADNRARTGTGSDKGRFVDHDGLTNIHAAVSQTLPKVLPDFDSLELFDNRGPPGSHPTKIMSWDGTRQTIQQPALYQEFLDKANAAPEGVAVPEGV